MTENSASTTASSPPAPEAEIEDATHRRNPVAQKAPATAVRVGEVSAPPPPPPSSSVAATQGASPVKDGAVKAAAAALAAARTAAKKVQSVMPEGSAKGPEDTAGAAPAPKAARKGAPADPRPEMHYSAGGVRGTAAPAAPTGSPMVGSVPGAAGPRRVRLSVSRVDPWSIMKLAFLLSVAIGFITVVATMVVWYVLNRMGTFATVQQFMSDTIGPQAVNLMQFVEFDRVISLSMLIAIVNIVLLTALATIMSILYNITAALVGGVHLTLTDE